jgi:hypothetical protein
VVVSPRQNCCKTGGRRRCHRNAAVESSRFCSLIVVLGSVTALVATLPRSDNCEGKLRHCASWWCCTRPAPCRTRSRCLCRGRQERRRQGGFRRGRFFRRQFCQYYRCCRRCRCYRKAEDDSRFISGLLLPP